jgi:hypothetical protein
MKARDVFFAILIIVFFAGGIGMIVKAVHAWVKSPELAKWRPATAIIESCRFVQGRDEEDDPTYTVEARYAYLVDGRHYAGDRIAFGYKTGGREEVHRAIYKKIHDAHKVRIKYNPLKPEESVLASGYYKETLIDFLSCATWMAFVIGMAAIFFITSGKDKALLRAIIVLESKTDDANDTLRPDMDSTAIHPRR